MIIFVTGASGFVGRALVPKLIQNGHKVLGLARSTASADLLTSLGVEPIHGGIEDHSVLQEGCKRADAVIHLAFIHDFANFQASCEADLESIKAMGSALEGTGKVFLGTSGLLALGGVGTQDNLADEETAIPASNQRARYAAEQYVSNQMRAMGIKSSVIRLSPTTHDEGDKAFIHLIIGSCEKAGYVCYPGDGTNVWAAVHRQDAAELYLLAVEAAHSSKPVPAVLHAAGEIVAWKDIAETIGKAKNLPVKGGVSQEELGKVLSFIAHFVVLDTHVSAKKTAAALGWEVKNIGLLADIEAHY
ncbi:NAD-dependent epimerase/dehydratase [Microstroma glucosiphilum]|uniref:NAD-dependent epimerase/dehydratase n=1 Tax=Pseudomicrostroma glucosiphilum TaxID=1684307 RepID=A0A316U344_9BASI|nr:NAD-dependent epimerase/dehydratase [Pseudomicrostroma glucosiphilum]PWN19258.1 NAD-dependent epimerase/dehydratase [Pseudomicrostroma glucosiphilum]